MHHMMTRSKTRRPMEESRESQSDGNAPTAAAQTPTSSPAPSPSMLVSRPFNHYEPPGKGRRRKRLRITMSKRKSTYPKPAPKMPVLHRFDACDNLPPPTPPKISNAKTTGPKVKRARTEYTKERGSPWEEENRHVDGPSFLDEEETPTVKRRGRGRPRKSVTPVRRRMDNTPSPGRKSSFVPIPGVRPSRSPTVKVGPNSTPGPQFQLPRTTASDRFLPPKKRRSSREEIHNEADDSMGGTVANSNGSHEQDEGGDGGDYIEVVLNNGERKLIARRRPQELNLERMCISRQPNSNKRAGSVCRVGTERSISTTAIPKPRSASLDAYRKLSSESGQIMKKYGECVRCVITFRKAFEGILTQAEVAKLADVLIERSDDWFNLRRTTIQGQASTSAANVNII